MPTQPLPITGGVVVTRNPSALEPGELTRASHWRRAPGDGLQLHKDGEFSTILDIANATGDRILCVQYMPFENGTNLVLLITEDGTNTYLETMPSNGSQTTTSQQTITGVATVCSVVHRGDQYFALTDKGNYVLSDDGTGVSVRAMGLKRTTIEPQFATVSTGALGATSAWDAQDYVGYWITEYDSTNDLESLPANPSIQPAISSAICNCKVTSGGHDPQLQFTPVPSSPFVTNATADFLRIYRTFLGKLDTGARQGAELSKGKTVPFVGGLVDQIDIPTSGGSITKIDDGETFGRASRFDPLQQYPIVALSVQAGGGLFEYLTPAANGGIGVLFNDSLLMTVPGESKQVVRYSPPSAPEYQPVPYFFFAATERSNEVVGLHVINDRLIMLQRNAVHRVNYLPFQGFVSGDRGRVQEEITGLHGCVSQSASTVVETGRGEFVAWLSDQGLMWTNGAGLQDACPDWSVDGALRALAPLSRASSRSQLNRSVLVNNPSKYRLELYMVAGNTVRWDFYYHPSLLKDGRLLAMGPTEFVESSGRPVDATVVFEGTVEVWIATEKTLYRQQFDAGESNATLEIGELHGPGGPNNEWTVDTVALTHTGTSGTTASLNVFGSMQDADTISEPTNDVTLRRAQTTRFMQGASTGETIQYSLTIKGNEDLSIGPMWLDMEGRQAGGD